MTPSSGNTTFDTQSGTQVDANSTSEAENSAVSIEVRVPGLLRDCTEGQGRVTVKATTLAQAVESLLVAYPRLRVHLYDEQGQLRRHILLFYNDTNFKDLDNLAVSLRPGDRLSVVQAVSGGRHSLGKSV